MHPTDPPLPLHPQVVLEVEEKVSGGHGTACEEMLRHPSRFEIVGRGAVREDVDKEFAAWFEGCVDFAQEQLVVLHVLEEFDGNYAVIGVWRELVINYVSSDDLKVLETF